MNVRLFTAIIFTATINSSIAATSTCESYQAKINHLQELNAKGGKLKQLEARRKQISKYEEESYKCSNKQIIAITTNTKKIKANHQKLRANKSQNPQLQQLIKTCNYWIEQNNTNPSWDNTNYRDTACRAADEGVSTIENPAPQIASNVRKLKDCIKPHNVIDDDVNECMKGNKEPDWKR